MCVYDEDIMAVRVFVTKFLFALIQVVRVRAGKLSGRLYQSKISVEFHRCWRMTTGCQTSMHTDEKYCYRWATQIRCIDTAVVCRATELYLIVIDRYAAGKRLAGPFTADLDGKVFCREAFEVLQKLCAEEICSRAALDGSWGAGIAPIPKLVCEREKRAAEAREESSFVL
jgi:hypothetical protein